MHNFLSNNRDELVVRCKEKVARRPTRRATAEQLAHGIPLFLDQLIRTLAAEERGEAEESLRISGAAGGAAASVSEMGVGAAVHGKELLRLGYSIDAVVHDYGDLCQSIADLAVERDAPFSVGEFRTLNRCLDNAIADAVTNFSMERDDRVARSSMADENERLGALVHELRNALQTATLAFRAIDTGTVGVRGTTGDLLRHSLSSLSAMLDKALWEVRLAAEMPFGDHPISVAAFVAEAARAASFSAQERNCSLRTSTVDPLLEISGDRERLMGALLNLLQNAFKFTRPGTDVSLSARADGDRVLIEVADHCGGLPAGATQTMFKPFAQVGADRSGVGLGLTIARRSVEAGGGQLSVRDVPGAGCVFSIRLPRWTQTGPEPKVTDSGRHRT